MTTRPRWLKVGDLTMRWTATSEGTTVTYERHGIVERRATIVSSATGYRLLDERGLTLAEADYATDGTLTVLDQECQVVQRWTDDQLRLLVQSHGTTLGESVALLFPSRCVCAREHGDSSVDELRYRRHRRYGRPVRSGDLGRFNK